MTRLSDSTTRILTEIVLPCCVILLAVLACKGTQVHIQTQGIKTNSARPGSNYRSFEVEGQELERCKRACRKEEKCRAWTYYKPDHKEKGNMCFLKDSVPEEQYNEKAVSGVIEDGEDEG